MTNYNEQNSELLELDPNSLQKPEWGNPRRSIQTQAYLDLKASIAAQGIHTPLQARYIESGYEIVAGQTRQQIAIELGLPKVPCMVRHLTDEQAFQLAMSENVDRTQMTFLDQALGLKQVVDNFNGDIKAAASQLGWSQAKFNTALQVLRTTKKVQELIGSKQENGFVLTVGHAAQLSILNNEHQNAIVDAVIRDKMTVNTLKEKINKAAKRPLSQAPFCTKACNGCEFNTDSVGQKALFDEGSDDAKCTNPTCYNEKQEAYFAIRTQELEQEYGKVVLLSTINSSLPISGAVVGQEQFEQGCIKCDKLCAILSDKGQSIGTILENQCLDGACATKHMAALSAPKTTNEKPTQAQPTTDKANKSNAKDNKQTAAKPPKGKSSQNPKPQAAVKAAPPKRLILESQTALRATAAKLLVDHPSYMLAVTLAALKQQSGNTNHQSMEDMVIKFIAMSPEELTDEASKTIDTISFDAQTERFNAERTMIKAAHKHIGQFKQQAIADWMPTKDRLKAMTKAIRLSALEDSGFASAYKAAKSEKEYAQLTNKGTNDQVDLILAFDFDWSKYAPDYFTGAITSQRYNF